MGKSLEFFSLDEGVKEQMSKGPEYQVANEKFEVENKQMMSRGGSLKEGRSLTKTREVTSQSWRLEQKQLKFGEF